MVLDKILGVSTCVLAVACGILMANLEGEKTKYANHIADDAATTARLVNEAREDERKLQKTADDADTETAQELEAIRLRLKPIKEKVNVYIPPYMDTSTVLPRGYIIMQNDAARGSVSPEAIAGSTNGTNAEPSGVGLGANGTVIAGNYEKYHACREIVEGWQKFYPKVREQYNGS